VIEVREYLTDSGLSPFGRWFSALHPSAAARIATALERIALGNFSNAKALGGGVSEYKIDFGPGYRIYFGKDGEVLVILLAGGTKKKQSNDIEAAKANWADYKKRKKQS
jgi:putative addiction module killer protein